MHSMRNVIVAVVYQSGFGHTARQAEAVRRGAAGIAGVRTVLLTAEDAQSRWDELQSADAIVFGTPTYMGSASAAFKSFMDASSSVFYGRLWQNKVAAGFTNSASRSGDKLGTLQQLAIFAAQHGMHWVSLGLLPGNNSSRGSEDDLNRLGFFLGAGAQSNSDEGPDTAPRASDLKTAEHLGKRVATVARELLRGRMVLETQESLTP
jgi:NAD(P)H dehydrogenase (quinone)